MAKKYQIIYADPPWEYKDKRDTHARLSGGATVHYPTMNHKEISRLPIGDLADDSCVLFLWATFPNLVEALEVIGAWGFIYKTIGFLWVKMNSNNMGVFFGIGYYTKSNAEPCLLAVRGHPKIMDNSISSIVLSPRMEHSHKPSIIRENIVRLMGNLPRIELFARRKVEGWDCWGNEVESDIDFEKLPEGIKEDG
jgi:site-specific DNA-methyltransferase (adenine-specific)